MYTLENIKRKYKLELRYGLQDVDFNTYLREKYIQTYDIDGNFIGWSVK